jgi:hypothetical protein
MAMFSSGSSDRPNRPARRTAMALAWLALIAVPVHADPRAELTQARHDLDVSEQVLARIGERVRLARADPATGDEQRVRLDAYLAYVRDLVAANRERVRSLAQQAGALPASTPGAASGSGGVARTDAEEVAALDTKLGDSLSALDALLLDEARKAQLRDRDRASADKTSGAGGGGASGGRGQRGAKSDPSAQGGQSADGESAGAGTPDSGNSAPQGPASEQGSPGGRVGGDRPGAPGGTAATPPDVGDGNDDDIVARQIRKAAESESDPELRRKLWEEYRKYKQGAKG